MAVPNYQSIMLPLLKLAGDGEDHSMRDAFEELAEDFGLTEEDRRELLPSGTQTVWENRVGWARTYLKKAGLVEYRKRGSFTITSSGMEVLNSNPSKIDNKYLMKFPDFVEFKTKSKDPITDPEKTPEEILESSYQKLRDDLAQDLLNQVKMPLPNFLKNWWLICSLKWVTVGLARMLVKH